MRKFTILGAMAAALVSTVGMAAEPEQQSFTHEGRTYVYTSAKAGNRTVIDGYEQGSRSKFHLTVRNGRVTGMSNGYPVSFRASDSAAATLAAAN